MSRVLVFSCVFTLLLGFGLLLTVIQSMLPFRFICDKLDMHVRPRYVESKKRKSGTIAGWCPRCGKFVTYSPGKDFWWVSKKY